MLDPSTLPTFVGLGRYLIKAFIIDEPIQAYGFHYMTTGRVESSRPTLFLSSPLIFILCGRVQRIPRSEKAPPPPLFGVSGDEVSYSSILLSG